MSVFQSGRLHKSCWDQFKKTGRHSHCACCIFKKTWAGAKSFRIFIKQWHVVDHRIPNLFAPNFLGNTAYFAAIARWGHTAHVSTVGGTFSTSGSSHSPCFFWIPFMYSTWGSRKKLNPSMHRNLIRQWYQWSSWYGSKMVTFSRQGMVRAPSLPEHQVPSISSGIAHWVPFGAVDVNVPDTTIHDRQGIRCNIPGRSGVWQTNRYHNAKNERW